MTRKNVVPRRPELVTPKPSGSSNVTGQSKEATKTKALVFKRDSQESIKLVPELVPAPLWGVSAYHLLKRNATWQKIRADAMARSNHSCVACGVTGVTLCCHDVFAYNDDCRDWLAAQVTVDVPKDCGAALLVDFEMHCRPCDAVTHIGRIRATAPEQEESVKAHMCRVNGITRRRADKIVDGAFEQWEQRNFKTWLLLVHESLTELYPELNALSRIANVFRQVAIGAGASSARPIRRSARTKGGSG